MTDWIKCSERMPERNVGVLVTDGEIVTAAEWQPMKLGPKDPRGTELPWWGGHGIGGPEWEWDFDHQRITHWMPLPSPP